jgi:hypothetical protein
VTETDAKRKENLSEELKDIGTCLDFLEDVKSLPDEFFSTDEIQSKAFDLMTATLGLIMLQVKYVTTSRGGLEVDPFRLTDSVRMAKQLTTKIQEEYESARDTLQTTIREYDRALDQGHRKMDTENLSITKSKDFISLKT